METIKEEYRVVPGVYKLKNLKFEQTHCTYFTDDLQKAFSYVIGSCNYYSNFHVKLYKNGLLLQKVSDVSYAVSDAWYIETVRGKSQ